MKVCRKCGSPLRDTDRFCSRCGARVPVSREEKETAGHRRKRREEQRKVHYQTAPTGRERSLDSFEEYESRSRALKMTVKALVVIAVLTALAVFAYTWKEKTWIFGPAYRHDQAIRIMQDTSEEEEAEKAESELQMQLDGSGN